MRPISARYRSSPFVVADGGVPPRRSLDDVGLGRAHGDDLDVELVELAPEIGLVFLGEVQTGDRCFHLVRVHAAASLGVFQ